MHSALLLSVLLLPVQEPASPFLAIDPTVIGTGYQFTEGPTWVASARAFIFCDLSGDAVYRWSGTEGQAPEVLVKPAKRVVGSTVLGKDIIQVSTAGRSLVKWQLDPGGKPKESVDFASRYGDKRLGGMNDLAAHPNGSVYVTHATWFIKPDEAEFDHSGVLRVSGDGTVSLVANEIARPNGICFNQDGSLAYVTEYSSGRILRFSVNKQDGTFSEKMVFAELNALATDRSIQGRGGADGIRCDVQGNVYSTGPGGIWVLSPAGKVLDHLPIRATNLAFGGTDGKTLLITTGSGASSIRTRYSGVWATGSK